MVGWVKAKHVASDKIHAITVEICWDSSQNIKRKHREEKRKSVRSILKVPHGLQKTARLEVWNIQNNISTESSSARIPLYPNDI